MQGFNQVYKNKKVFITGHTGFKGSWLTLWLTKLGATVCGYSLNPPTSPNHFNLLFADNSSKLRSIIADINDYTSLYNALQTFEPDIIFHLAAQPLVRQSYQSPIQTFQTNAIGTLNLLHISTTLKNLKAIINITTDKVYENQEHMWGYRENDPLGGYDPYSASKACSEIITSSMQRSFFPIEKYNKSHNVLIATARAGNVIGGGDWSNDRLMVDAILSVTQKTPAIIRSPKAIRPWQHVLEPLNGYLILGEQLLNGNTKLATSFNFGPTANDDLSVEEVLLIAQQYWNQIKYQVQIDSINPHEAEKLMLDITKAQKILNWQPKWDAKTSIQKTIQWYQAFYTQNQILTHQQLEDFVSI